MPLKGYGFKSQEMARQAERVRGGSWSKSAEMERESHCIS